MSDNVPGDEAKQGRLRRRREQDRFRRERETPEEKDARFVNPSHTCLPHFCLTKAKWTLHSDYYCRLARCRQNYRVRCDAMSARYPSLSIPRPHPMLTQWITSGSPPDVINICLVGRIPTCCNILRRSVCKFVYLCFKMYDGCLKWWLSYEYVQVLLGLVTPARFFSLPKCNMWAKQPKCSHESISIAFTMLHGLSVVTATSLSLGKSHLVRLSWSSSARLTAICSVIISAVSRRWQQRYQSLSI